MTKSALGPCPDARRQEETGGEADPRSLVGSVDVPQELVAVEGPSPDPLPLHFNELSR